MFPFCKVPVRFHPQDLSFYCLAEFAWAADSGPPMWAADPQGSAAVFERMDSVTLMGRGYTVFYFFLDYILKVAFFKEFAPFHLNFLISGMKLCKMSCSVVLAPLDVRLTTCLLRPCCRGLVPLPSGRGSSFEGAVPTALPGAHCCHVGPSPCPSAPRLC